MGRSQELCTHAGKIQRSAIQIHTTIKQVHRQTRRQFDSVGRRWASLGGGGGGASSVDAPGSNFKTYLVLRTNFRSRSRVVSSSIFLELCSLIGSNAGKQKKTRERRGCGVVVRLLWCGCLRGGLCAAVLPCYNSSSSSSSSSCGLDAVCTAVLM